MSGRHKAIRAVGSRRRVASWSDWAARRPLGIELPKRLTRLKPARLGPPAGGPARCADCPRGGCAGCPLRRGQG